MLFFKILCFDHVHEEDDIDEDHDDVVKNVRSNSTAPWNWFSRANSTAPRNQFHDVCGVGLRNEFRSTLKPIPRSREILFGTKNRNSAVPLNHFHDQLNKFHGTIEEIPWCHGIGVTDYTERCN